MSLREDSIFLSLLLRHKPEVLKLDMDNGGWVGVTQLVNNSHGRFTVEKLQEILETERSHKSKHDKDRYSVTHDFTKIRANQGHSIKGLDLGLEFIQPPEFLYHGTAHHNIESIMSIGIVCNNPEYSARVDVHLSSDKETALNVGARHIKTNNKSDHSVVLVVKTGDMYKDNFKFKCSDNGVWLTDDVPPKYISHLG